VDENKRDPTRVDPVSGGEEPKPAAPLQTVPQWERPDATSAVIPGTGKVIRDTGGGEARRTVTT
jgi:hypothetical protein